MSQSYQEKAFKYLCVIISSSNNRFPVQFSFQDLLSDVFSLIYLIPFFTNIFFCTQPDDDRNSCLYF